MRVGPLLMMPLGERKVVTVLFADIVGSTSLAERLDVEDWRDLLEDVHRRGDEAVNRHGGLVAQHLGDGLLALFGAPVTHEDDPLRAVRAALDLQRSIRELPDDPAVRLRIGIDTGTIVVGPFGEPGGEYTGTGEAMNRSARLQAAAPPGGVLASGATYAAVAQSVLADDLGEIDIRGSSVPAHVWAVLALRAAPTGPRAPGGRRLATVGRDRELRRLSAAWESVDNGHGHVVVVTGEPGVGKTHLVDAWLSGAAGAEACLVAKCTSLSLSQPYALVVALLRGLLGLGWSPSSSEVRDAITASAGTSIHGEEALARSAVLARILSLPSGPDDDAVLDAIGPRGFGVMAGQLVSDCVAARATAGRLALVWEDVHWADPSSAALLAKVLVALVHVPVLVCIVTRVEPGSAGWSLVEAAADLGDLVTRLDLEGLGPGGTRQLIASLAGEAISDAVVDRIVSRAGGNPLFVAEVVGAVLDANAELTVHGHTPHALDKAAVDLIPDSLSRLLLARVDRLPAGPKRTLRIASVIGREFDLDLLAAVVAAEGGGHGSIVDDLGAARASGLVEPVGGGDGRFAFRHVLLQEAAYGSLLRADRRPLHLAVGELLERAAGDHLAEVAPTLAMHFERAGSTVQALRYFVLGGDEARRRYANLEAIALYQAAIAHVDTASATSPPADVAADRDGESRAASELAALPVDLRIRLGELLSVAGRRDEALVVLEEALARLPETSARARARVQRAVGEAWMEARCFDEARGALTFADVLLNEVAAPARSWQVERLALDLARLWLVYWLNEPGDMEALVPQIEPALGLVGSDAQRARFHALLALHGLIASGFNPPPATAERADVALAFARASGSLEELEFSGFVAGFVRLWRGDLDAAATALRDTIATGERIGDRVTLAPAWAYLTAVARRRHDKAEVAALVSASVAAAEAAGLRTYRGVAQSHLAWARMQHAPLSPTDRTALRADLTTALDDIDSDPTYPFRSWVHWPAIGLALEDADVPAAVASARAILAPRQLRQPPDVAAALEKAVILADGGSPAPLITEQLVAAMAAADARGLT